MAQHNQTGNLGEAMAKQYLRDNGFCIMHQNWRYARYEVDIIAEKNKVLHFIEVKTRRTRKFGYPEDNVDKKKIHHLINAAEAYLIQSPQWQRIQFDILAITMQHNEPVEYYFIEDVYLWGILEQNHNAFL